MEFGIIGLGTHGLNHATVLERLGHGVVGVDASGDKRRAFEDQFGGETYESPDVISTDDVAAVVIATPNKFHEATTIDALEAGFDVLVEKPLAHTLESAQRIAETAEETEQICAVSFSNKYQSACSVAREYAKSGRLGEITHVRARHVRRRGIPGRGTWYTSRDIAGGGVLMDIGANLINVLLYLIGWPEVVQVMGECRSEFGKQDDYAYLEMYGEDGQAKMYDVDDSVVAFCSFENGTTASLEVAWAANARTQHQYTVQGTDAGIELKLSNDLAESSGDAPSTNELQILKTRSAGVNHHMDTTVAAPEWDPLEREMEEFIAAVKSGSRPELNNVHQGMAVQRAIDEIYTASDRA